MSKMIGFVHLAAVLFAILPSQEAAPLIFENCSKNATVTVVADHWKEIIAGFRPFNFIVYDFLVDNDTRLVGPPIHDEVGGSLAIVRKLIAEGVQAADDLTNVDPVFSPLFIRVMSENFATFNRLLRNEDSEARLERFLTTLRMSDVASFGRIQSIVVDPEVNATFVELRSTLSNDLDDSFFPTEAYEVILDCLNSFISVLQDPSFATTNVEDRLVDPRFVGPVARYILHEIAGDEANNRESVLTHFMASGTCKAAELRKQADHLMALVNTGMLLEATFINKNIIPYGEQVKISRKEMELHYKQAREKVDELAGHCSN